MHPTSRGGSYAACHTNVAYDMKVRLMLRRENAVPAVWGSRDLSAEFGASTVTQGLALDPTDRRRAAALRRCRAILNQKLIRQSVGK